MSIPGTCDAREYLSPLDYRDWQRRYYASLAGTPAGHIQDHG